MDLLVNVEITKTETLHHSVCVCVFYVNAEMKRNNADVQFDVEIQIRNTSQALLSLVGLPRRCARRGLRVQAMLSQ